MKHFPFILFGILIIFTVTLQAQISQIEQKLFDAGLVDISTQDKEYIIDLKYTTTDNFTGKILYDSIRIPFLHPLAAQKLLQAHTILKQKYPNYRFIIFDVARPLNIQRRMFEIVQGTPYQAYVANPERTGLHNYGMAVDLSIVDIVEQQEIDMGTPFDFFGAKAGINKEQEVIEQGKLTQRQVENRIILRSVMQSCAFIPIRGEWWHFNAVPLQKAKTEYQLIE